ncbi:hypothetical protein [Actinocrispum sp. NPDC049592]|uniref:hypothetical protein n=1 Tax=Actinocrispum sp. NPDC049592 TaxID=3154835 RepID=UPI00344647E7
MAFHATWEVGYEPTVSVHKHTKSAPPHLLLTGGGNTLTLASPISSTKYPEYADFLRDLARKANHVAAELDPDGEPLTGPPSEVLETRVLFLRDEEGDAGGGHKP